MSYADLKECEAEITHLESRLTIMKGRRINIERQLAAEKAVQRCPECDMAIRISADVPGMGHTSHTQATCDSCKHSYYVHVRLVGEDPRDPSSYHFEFVDAGYNMGEMIIEDLDDQEFEGMYKAAVQEKRRRAALGMTGMRFGKKDVRGDAQ